MGLVGTHPGTPAVGAGGSQPPPPAVSAPSGGGASGGGQVPSEKEEVKEQAKEEVAATEQVEEYVALAPVPPAPAQFPAGVEVEFEDFSTGTYYQRKARAQAAAAAGLTAAEYEAAVSVGGAEGVSGVARTPPPAFRTAFTPSQWGAMSLVERRALIDAALALTSKVGGFGFTLEDKQRMVEEMASSPIMQSLAERARRLNRAVTMEELVEAQARFSAAATFEEKWAPFLKDRYLLGKRTTEFIGNEELYGQYQAGYEQQKAAYEQVSPYLTEEGALDVVRATAAGVPPGVLVGLGVGWNAVQGALAVKPYVTAGGDVDWGAMEGAVGPDMATAAMLQLGMEPVVARETWERMPVGEQAKWEPTERYTTMAEEPGLSGMYGAGLERLGLTPEGWLGKSGVGGQLLTFGIPTMGVGMHWAQKGPASWVTAVPLVGPTWGQTGLYWGESAGWRKALGILSLPAFFAAGPAVAGASRLAAPLAASRFVAPVVGVAGKVISPVGKVAGTIFKPVTMVTKPLAAPIEYQLGGIPHVGAAGARWGWWGGTGTPGMRFEARVGQAAQEWAGVQQELVGAAHPGMFVPSKVTTGGGPFVYWSRRPFATGPITQPQGLWTGAGLPGKPVGLGGPLSVFPRPFSGVPTRGGATLPERGLFYEGPQYEMLPSYLERMTTFRPPWATDYLQVLGKTQVLAQPSGGGVIWLPSESIGGDLPYAARGMFWGGPKPAYTGVGFGRVFAPPKPATLVGPGGGIAVFPTTATMTEAQVAAQLAALGLRPAVSAGGPFVVPGVGLPRVPAPVRFPAPVVSPAPVPAPGVVPALASFLALAPPVAPGSVPTPPFTSTPVSVLAPAPVPAPYPYFVPPVPYVPPTFVSPPPAPVKPPPLVPLPPLGLPGLRRGLLGKRGRRRKGALGTWVAPGMLVSAPHPLESRIVGGMFGASERRYGAVRPRVGVGRQPDMLRMF